MVELLVVLVVALLVIAGSTVLGPRLGIASPIVLLAVGIAASFVPAFGEVHIEPEWILEGVLPPLLYSAAVSMPAMNFRREFSAISGLSIALVVVSSLLLGVFFVLVLPDLGFAWGVALGAIISPTDAVATSIIKRTPVSQRVVAMLDGESLLNDATALVLLRTAIVSAAAAFSFWGTLGSFALAVAVAVVVGGLVGMINLAIRRRVTDPTVNTLISFTVPFLAAVPAELLHGSGLVAAVVAGLVTGIRAPRELSPQNRLSDAQNWRTVELVLEGLVFLTMGLQVKEIVTTVQEEHAGVGPAMLIALGALVLTVLIRALYVAPLLGYLGRRARRGVEFRDRLVDMQAKIGTEEGAAEIFDRGATRGRPVSERRINSFATRITRGLADVDYFLRQPLGWREGAIVVWAGMRGAVTVAAAQSLPVDTPNRAVLVLIAFAVAVLSLVVQGGTIGWLVRRIAAPVDEEEAAGLRAAEVRRIFELMRAAAEPLPVPERPGPDPTPADFAAAKEHRLAVLRAQRTALLDARDNGTFDADLLERVLTNLDADEIALQLRGELAD